MSAPPAFQFYASDFVGGTMGFTAEQTGAYILLLCYQWMNGSVPDDDEAIAAVGRCSRLAVAVLRRKFVAAPDGYGLINVRLEEVRLAQNQFLSKQAESGRKGGLASKRRSTEPQPSLEQASSSPISDLHTPKEESTRASCDVPSWEEFWSYCQIAGMASEWYAKDKFFAAAQENWKRMPNWQAYVGRCRAWWENEGRPMRPKTAGAPSGEGQFRKKPPKPHVDCYWSEPEWRWIDTP